MAADTPLAEELDRAIRKHLLLKSADTEVMLLADFPATRVPLDEFRSEEAQALYKITFGEQALQGLSLRYEPLAALEVVEVFAVNADAERIVRAHWPEATIRGFYAEALLQAQTTDKRSEHTQRRLYANMEGTDLFLCTFSEGRLQFANTYPAPRLSSRLYFTLGLWNQLGMDHLKDTCVLQGDRGEMRQALSKYIRNILCV